MRIEMNKSYVVIDTPESCCLCSLSFTDRYDELCCPLLINENLGNLLGDCRHEKCPLKKMTIAADIEV